MYVVFRESGDLVRRRSELAYVTECMFDVLTKK
jgi:hypothetical protein